MAPEVLAGEWREWLNCVADETAGGVSVESKHEGNEQVVSVPKRLEGLLTDFSVGGRVHQKHN